MRRRSRSRSSNSKSSFKKSESKMSGVVLGSEHNFTLAVLKELSESQPGNVVVSPISILTVLSMVFSGAGPQGKEEFKKAVGYEGDEEEWNQYFSTLQTQIDAENKPYTLDSASKLYLKQGFSLKDGFKKNMEKFFKSGFEELDYSNPLAASKKINDFVSDKTRGKITDLISADAINDMTRLILINALYFKSAWENEFNPNKTIDKLFYSKADSSKQVKMMKQKETFVYFEDSELQLLGLPYKGSGVYMFVILPQEKHGLDNLLKNLTQARLTELLKKRGKAEVHVELPRFKVSAKYVLNQPLKQVGLTNAFGSGADFTEISDDKLQIDQVIHQVFIETNEEGSEAAAATGITMRLLSAMVQDKELYFTADHPFFFAIATRHGDVLFNGAIRDL